MIVDSNALMDLPNFNLIIDNIAAEYVQYGKPHSFNKLSEETQKELVVTYYLQKVSYLEKNEIFVESHGSEDFGHLLMCSAMGLVSSDQFVDYIFKAATKYFEDRIDEEINFAVERFLNEWTCPGNDLKPINEVLYDQIRGI